MQITPTIIPTNFNLLDPVVQYCTTSFEMTLVLIGQIYVQKIVTDTASVCVGGRGAGGRAGGEEGQT